MQTSNHSAQSPEAHRNSCQSLQLDADLVETTTLSDVSAMVAAAYHVQHFDPETIFASAGVGRSVVKYSGANPSSDRGTLPMRSFTSRRARCRSPSYRSKEKKASSGSSSPAGSLAKDRLVPNRPDRAVEEEEEEEEEEEQGTRGLLNGRVKMQRAILEGR
jgi:hypothetical protein